MKKMDGKSEYYSEESKLAEIAKSAQNILKLWDEIQNNSNDTEGQVVVDNHVKRKIKAANEIEKNRTQLIKQLNSLDGIEILEGNVLCLLELPDPFLDAKELAKQGDRARNFIAVVESLQNFLSQKEKVCNEYQKYWKLRQVAEQILKAHHLDREKFYNTREVERVRRISNFAFQMFQCKAKSPYKTEEREALENLVTAIYLEEWLDNDYSTYRSVYSEAQRILGTIKRGNAPDDATLKEMTRASNILLRMYSERHVQADEESYQEKWMSEHRKYSLTHICAAKLLAEHKLELLELLWFRKTPMVNTSDKGSHESLIRAYQAYSNLLDSHEWDGIDFEKKENWEAAQEYVVRNMCIRQIESGYHFHLVKCVAEYLEEHAETADQMKDQTGVARSKVLCNCESMWGRGWYISILSGEKRRCDVYDVLYEFEKTKKVLGGEDIRKQADEYRVATSALLEIMNILIPPRQQKKWERQDFCDAASFFEKYYPVCRHNKCQAEHQSRQPVKKSLEEKENEVKENQIICKRIEKIYSDLLNEKEFQEAGFLKFCETLMQFKRDKRYDKKK